MALYFALFPFSIWSHTFPFISPEVLKCVLYTYFKTRVKFNQQNFRTMDSKTLDIIKKVWSAVKQIVEIIIIALAGGSLIQ